MSNSFIIFPLSQPHRSHRFLSSALPQSLFERYCHLERPIDPIEGLTHTVQTLIKKYPISDALQQELLNDVESIKTKYRNDFPATVLSPSSPIELGVEVKTLVETQVHTKTQVNTNTMMKTNVMQKLISNESSPLEDRKPEIQDPLAYCELVFDTAQQQKRFQGVDDFIRLSTCFIECFDTAS